MLGIKIPLNDEITNELTTYLVAHQMFHIREDEPLVNYMIESLSGAFKFIQREFLSFLDNPMTWSIVQVSEIY